jgi:MFS family permease
MDATKKNVSLLAALQALLFTNNSTVIALNGLAGYALASNKAFATLPVTGWVVGAALSTVPASMLMRRFGRRAGFTVGAVTGILGALICSLALWLSSFWLLCCGTIVFGVYNAFGQYYRFAAADASKSDFKARAISLVLAGGLVGGIVGPQFSQRTVDLFTTQYMGAYLSLIFFLVIVIVLLRWLDIPPPSEAELAGPVRPMREIAVQPAFFVAVTAATVGYGVMNLLMVSTPLAMGFCGHPFGDAATVIGWHVIGMFGPSFFTGSLIKRFGVLSVMFVGALILYVCVAIALSGITVAHFWASMVLLGIGWNFLYIGGTTLLTESYRPSEKAKVQGINDMIIFVTMATTSFSSGLLLDRNGWDTINYLALPFISIAVVGLLWMMIVRRGQAMAA